MDEREKIQAEMDKAIKVAKYELFKPVSDAKYNLAKTKKYFEDTPRPTGFNLFISSWICDTKKSKEWDKAFENLIKAERDLRVVFRPTKSQVEDAIEKAKLPFIFQLKNISKSKPSSKLFDDDEILEEEEESDGGSPPPPFKI